MGPQADTILGTDQEKIDAKFAEMIAAERQVDAAFGQIDRDNNPLFVDNLVHKPVSPIDTPALTASRTDANAEARSSIDVRAEQVPGLQHILRYGQALKAVREGTINPAPAPSANTARFTR